MQTTARPRKIQRYRLLSEIGRGAMSRVYLAEDPHVGRKIALKVLTAPETRNREGEEAGRGRFLREARVAGRLNHPGIVAVYDAGVDPETGTPYLAMEWVKGRSLRALLGDGGPLPLETALSHVSGAAEALDHAHRQGVIHRDVKPGNLLVADDGTVKVADFGIAKLASESTSEPGTILGTPYYMAPEQIEGDQVDGRTDLFALGSVLYRCVTGRLAFGGEHLADVRHRILSAAPEPAETYNAEIPPSLGRLLDRALQKRPVDRFQTGAEMVAALEEARRDLDVPGDESLPRVLDWAPGAGADTSRPAQPENEPETPAGGADAPPRRRAPWPIFRRSFAARWTRLALLAIATTVLVVQLGRLPPDADLRETGEAALELADQKTEPFRRSLRRSWSRWLGRPAEARTVEPAPRIETATLEIRFRHRLAAGFLSVWIDGHLVMSENLEVGALGFLFGRTVEREIPVLTGRRQIEIQISGLSMQIDARETITGDFADGGRRRLSIRLEPGYRELTLELQ